MLMTFFTAYQSYLITHKTYDLQLESNKPHLSPKITAREMPYWRGEKLKDEYIVEKDELNSSSIDVPVYIQVTNWGSINTQIDGIYWNSTCTGDGGLFDLPPVTLIKPGESFNINKIISTYAGQGKTIEKIIPCDIKIFVGGPNFGDIKGRITLKAE